MSQKKILIFEIIICILILISLYMITHYIYADVYHIDFIESLLYSWIFSTFFSWKKEINTVRPKFRWFTFFLIGITIVIFVAFKPNLSYNQGKNVITDYGYIDVHELEDKSITALRSEHTRLVPDVYLYAGEKDNIKYYILLSPINGEFETMRIGEGNYLDKYFEIYRRYRR